MKYLRNHHGPYFKSRAFQIIFLLGILKCVHFTAAVTPAICQTKESCDSCIGTFGCSWCKELKSAYDNLQRCNTKQGHRSNKCSEADIVEAGKSSFTVTRNEPLTETIRINPQGIDLKLAVGQEISIDLRYNDSQDKPLDLYYIMDLSATMEDDKKTVSKQAVNLRNELKKITKNVQLGFGSFIDKPVLPFVSSSQLRPNENRFAIPYGFKNWLKLTDNVNQFENIVNNAQISSNLDEPEGTLDALMQAITCIDEIGWRNNSRKLIVVATDGPFHIAGDGKLGGIVRPNDMKCHMENDMYTHSTLLDYPSIGEINAVIVQHKVYVIFAVSVQQDEKVFKVYEELEKHITQSTAEKLLENSGNVVEKIRTKYKEISQTVTLNIEEQPKHVNVTVFANCANRGWEKTKSCKGVTFATEISFKLLIQLKECPRYNTGPDKIKITFFELTATEKLEIDLTYLCKCNCNDDQIQDAAKLKQYCSGLSYTKSISCGVCNCREGRYGQSCECSQTDINDQGDRTQCIDTSGNFTDVVCNDRGLCQCGQCKCHSSDYTGKYCEDSTEPCQNMNQEQLGRICSDNGQCIKGKCECSQGFEGKFCECESSRKVSCVEPGRLHSEVCNGHGICDCKGSEAKCKCDSGYTGLYCGICKVNCPPSSKQRSRCGDTFLQKCMHCKFVQNNSPANQNHTSISVDETSKCSDLCNWRKYTEQMRLSTKEDTQRGDVESIEFFELAELDVDGIECQVQINSTCFARFIYNYAPPETSSGGSDVLHVFYVPNGVTCAKEPPILWIIFIVILSVLLAGIIGLLIWKLATHLHDTREFQRFEKERSKAKWQGGENPLYNKPMSEFQNPAYRD